jgi:hypothetical protein
MLALSRSLNPECEHVQGDMRDLRLDRTFDAVLLHDAVMYMLTENDLRSAIETATVHLRPGGVLLVLPDVTRETLAPDTHHGGHDGGDGRSLRYLQWLTDPDPDDTTYDVDFVVLLREAGKPLRVEHDHQVFGVFPEATWRTLLDEAGLQVLDPGVEDPHAGERVVFVARMPA